MDYNAKNGFFITNEMRNSKRHKKMLLAYYRELEATNAKKHAEHLEMPE